MDDKRLPGRPKTRPVCGRLEVRLPETLLDRVNEKRQTVRKTLREVIEGLLEAWVNGE